MHLFLYLDRDTFIHRLDPRTKIIGTLLFFVLTLVFHHPVYMALVVVTLLLVGAAAQSLLNFVRMRYILILLFVFSSIIWPFFTHGPTVLWKWGPLTLTKESLLYGVAMGLRLSAMLMAGLVFLSTTRVEELTAGLIGLKVPYPMAFAFSTALRLVPTFAGAGATIVQAQISRGLDLQTGNPIARAKRFIPLAVPLFIYAIRHANLMAMALESKGFSPERKRTYYMELRLRLADYVVLLLLFGLNLGLLLLRLCGYGVILPGKI